jgi:uncharacterized RDD family membrane protein YckC
MSSFGQDYNTGQPRGFGQQLYIDTPEQVELQFAVAGIGSRFVALLLDSLIMIGVYVIEILLLVWLASNAPKTESTGLDTAGKWFIAILIFLNFCFFEGYFALFEAYWHGQTPGKRAMKLRVIKDTGRQITLFEALARNLLRVIDYLPGMYFVGVVTMLCNKQNKRLGDLAAGTIVVHEAHDEQPLMVNHGARSLVMSATPLAEMTHEIDMKGRAAPIVFPADAVAKLDPADLAVIDMFFSRALDLSLEVRAAMAVKIATQMTTKMGVALPEGNPERALEAMAVQRRGGGRGF